LQFKNEKRLLDSFFLVRKLQRHFSWQNRPSVLPKCSTSEIWKWFIFQLLIYVDGNESSLDFFNFICSNPKLSIFHRKLFSFKIPIIRSKERDCVKKNLGNGRTLLIFACFYSSSELRVENEGYFKAIFELLILDLNSNYAAGFLIFLFGKQSYLCLA
jgi:hypothetical protein